MSDRVRIEMSPKRVRVALGGAVIADSTDVRLVWETPAYPTYYFPVRDVMDGVLRDRGETGRSPSRGDATRYDVVVGETVAPDSAFRHLDSPVEELRNLVSFRWAAMDAWFEEDEQVYVHARNPYTRVDVLQSSRHVRVEIDGVTVAETTAPRLLFETGLPTRYYIPPTDVRRELLVPSVVATACPYKGVAGYHSVVIDGDEHTDVVWHYSFPLRESELIAGYLCFYNERVDIFVDGVLQERPRTAFSSRRAATG